MATPVNRYTANAPGGSYRHGNAAISKSPKISNSSSRFSSRTFRRVSADSHQSCHSIASQSWLGSISVASGGTEDTEEHSPMDSVVDISDAEDEPSVMGIDDLLKDHTRNMNKPEQSITKHNKNLELPSMKEPTHSPAPVRKMKAKRDCGEFLKKFMLLYALLYLVGVVATILFRTGFIASLQAPPPGLPNDTTTNSMLVLPGEDIGEKMLLLAERIVKSCSEWEVEHNMTECNQLCEMHMCCFEPDENNSCDSDEDKNCPVHAGCQVLVGIEQLEEGM